MKSAIGIRICGLPSAFGNGILFDHQAEISEDQAEMKQAKGGGRLLFAIVLKLREIAFGGGYAE